ncbi:Speckle-type POZ protein [Strongyloides ratti]|uniref:Speckle-type POZ protein n=1 Tax=Strongyloides ratti TaxID=34506 RepID=A0A090MXS0_STRRB|nr:Speckle-type POZ protein [Strongyloides ratti]CEF65919.1 Speckle-type POZ protein [Strongyloides ratti]
MEPSQGEIPLTTVSSQTPIIHTTNASQTEIRVENITHSWTVKNFSHCYQEYLENFVYLPHGKEHLQWSIKIYPKGNGENNKDFVFLCLNRVLNNGSKNKIGFRSRFTLKNNEGKEIEMRIHPNPSHSDYVAYIKRDVLFPQILPNDSIIVFVEINVAVETITTTLDDTTTLCNCEKQLCDDYLKLLDGTLTDFVIKVGSQEIRTHKAILAARSPVFEAMFSHQDTSESKSGSVVIEDIEYDVFKELVIFIYSGKIATNKKELAADLMIAADKYGLIELRNHCELSLIKSLSCENVCQLLILADLYNAEKLKKNAVSLILQRPTEVTHSLGWTNVVREHPELVTDIVRHFDKSTINTTSTTEPSTPTINLNDL